MANPQNLKPFTGVDDPRRSTKPKGAIHLSTRIQNMLNDDDFTVEEVVEGKRIKFKGNPADAIIRTAFIKAKNGDKPWADWLAQNGYGSKTEVSVISPARGILQAAGLLEGKGDGQTTEDTESTSSSTT